MNSPARTPERHAHQLRRTDRSRSQSSQIQLSKSSELGPRSGVGLHARVRRRFAVRGMHRDHFAFLIRVLPPYRTNKPLAK